LAYLAWHVPGLNAGRERAPLRTKSMAKTTTKTV